MPWSELRRPSRVLEGSSIARIADEINPAAERHIETLGAQLLADDRAIGAR